VKNIGLEEKIQTRNRATLKKETYASNEDLLHPHLTILLRTSKRMKIIRRVLEKGQVIGGLDRKCEWLRGPMRTGYLVRVKVRQRTEKGLVSAVIPL